jgi:hypothetical protein
MRLEAALVTVSSEKVATLRQSQKCMTNIPLKSSKIMTYFQLQTIVTSWLVQFRIWVKFVIWLAGEGGGECMKFVSCGKVYLIMKVL